MTDYSKTFAGIFFLFTGVSALYDWLDLAYRIPFIGWLLPYLFSLILVVSVLGAGVLYLQSSFKSADSKPAKK